METLPHSWQRRNITMNNGTLKKEYENSLDYFHFKGIITDEQYYAGDRLFKAFIRSGLDSKSGMNLSDEKGKLTSLDDKQNENELLYREAIMAIDPYERQIVRNVCCFSEWLTTSEKVRLLRRGLDDLDKFWSGRKSA